MGNGRRSIRDGLQYQFINRHIKIPDNAVGTDMRAICAKTRDKFEGIASRTAIEICCDILLAGSQDRWIGCINDQGIVTRVPP